MIKKILLGVMVWIIGVWLIYAYFFSIGNGAIVWEWIQTNPLITVIFFWSVISIFALQWGNKIAKLCMILIIVIDLFLVGDMFFRNTIGLDKTQYILLFWLILVALATTYIRHRIRFILVGIVSLGIILVVMTGVLPLYDTIPNINDFILSQKSKIIKQGTSNQWILTIKNAMGSKDIPIESLQQQDINLSQKTQISYAAQTSTDSGKIVIDLGNGAFINIGPQSAVTLQQSWTGTLMEILEGNIEYYAPPELSWVFQVIGKYTGKSIQDIQNSVRSDLNDQFQQKKEKFFMNQIGGDIILNPIVDKMINFFINALYIISPKSYQKNMDNYKNIQTYLSGYVQIRGSSASTGVDMKSMIDNLMLQVKKWTEETTIFNKLLNK